MRMKLVQIPTFDDFFISKNGNVFQKKNSELIEIKPIKKKFYYIKINSIEYRLDYLLMKSFIGEIGIKIIYKDGDYSFCELSNLLYDVKKEEFIDDYLFLNGLPIIFKKIPGSESDFITKNGIVYSIYLHRFKPIMHRQNGYYAHNVTIDSVSKKMYTHRLVYLTWIGNLDPERVIDHLNGKVWDNDISNLELVTPKENNIRAYETNLKERVWTDLKLEIVCKLMSANFNKDDICRALDIKDASERKNISYLIDSLKKGKYANRLTKKYDLSKYNNSDYHYEIISDEMKKVIYELVSRDYKSTEISRITGLNRSTVLNYIRKHVNNMSSTTIGS